MALTDTAVRNYKHSGRPAGDKHSDSGGLYLLVKAAGRYWRMDYRFADKRKTLARSNKAWLERFPIHKNHNRLSRQAHL